jgi:hypothetical protein
LKTGRNNGPFLFLVASLLGHLLIFSLLDILVPQDTLTIEDDQTTSLTILSPVPEPEVEEPKRPDFSGQIVEIAPPLDQTPPEESDYLAEHNATVPEESQTEQFKINPDVLSHTYSTDSQYEKEEAFDLNIEEMSTGATVGNDKFDPNEDGTLASLPSKYTLTNREGPEDPIPSSSKTANMAGAPQNDLLTETRSDTLALNTREFLYASYLNRIRRLVNFYWQQNLSNLSHSQASRLSKPVYTTKVSVILDSFGSVIAVDVTRKSGNRGLDSALVRAYNLAGPFPNPPAGLIASDGRIYLPDMSWTVSIGTGQLRYQGVDPRAGVRFPGLLKSPR